MEVSPYNPSWVFQITPSWGLLWTSPLKARVDRPKATCLSLALPSHLCSHPSFPLPFGFSHP
jgi:hypothetical protein